MPKLPTASELAYYKSHPNDSLVTDIIVCCSICGVASIIFILLRLWSRWLIYNRIVVNTSDWLLIIAWVFFAVFDVCFALTTKYGGGRHIIYITDAKMLQILNIMNENLYCFCMAFIKLSILKLYGDIFRSKRFHRCLWAVSMIMIAWTIACLFATMFQCTPIAFSWDVTIIGGSCINYGAVVIGAGAINIFTDLTILVIPIPMVWRLHTSQRKKWQILFAFALGSSACIISIVRLGFAAKVGSTADGSWDNIPGGLASTAELMAGILAASIPTYRPVYRRIFYGSPVESTQASSNNRHHYASHSFGTNASSGVQISSKGPNSSSITGSGINVTNQVEMIVYNVKPSGHTGQRDSYGEFLISE